MIDGVTGILYENDDPEGFCQKVAYILSHKEELATLEKNAKERALSMSWDAMAEKMRNVLDKVMG